MATGSGASPAVALVPQLLLPSSICEVQDIPAVIYVWMEPRY